MAKILSKPLYQVLNKDVIQILAEEENPIAVINWAIFFWKYDVEFRAMTDILIYFHLLSCNKPPQKRTETRQI